MNYFVPDGSESPFATIEKVERWPAGEIIFREGERPQGVFVLYSGTVDLVFSARNGAKRSLRTVYPGEVLGLSDAVTNTPHDCTATTRSGVRVGFIPVDVLRGELSENPSLWLSIAKLLSADLGSCWASMRTLAVAR
jgi:CRP/FNR family transcriptional regulator